MLRRTDRSQPAPGSTVTADTLTIQRLAGRHGLLLDGEADINSRHALRDALRTLMSDGPGEIHLELAGLTFIDVSCTRELVVLTQFPRPVRVILHNPPWSLQQITTLAWPHASIEVGQDQRA
jgi:anti-anti-sigma regulatory factor